MPRTKITSTSRDAITDDGNVLISYIAGEQLELDFTVGWMSSLANAEIKCKVIEAVNDSSGSRPTQVQAGGVERFLQILDSNGNILSSRTFQEVVGETDASPPVATNVTVEQRSGTNAIRFNNVTQAIAFAYMTPGKQFQVAGNTYTIASGSDYAFQADDNQVLAFVSSSTNYSSIPASGSPADALLEDDHTDASITGNQFRVVLPDDLVTGQQIGNSRHAFMQQPTPGNAVYGFIGMEIAEAASGTTVQQKWRPLRGQIEILYSVIDA